MSKTDLPIIPQKRYFTIGEVSQLCAVKPHVLRYWEQEFAQLKPSKRRGNRRYYRRQDVMMVREIRSLLYEQGYTISGARTQLTTHKSETTESVLDNPQTALTAPATNESVAVINAERNLPAGKSFQTLIDELQSVLETLQ